MITGYSLSDFKIVLRDTGQILRIASLSFFIPMAVSMGFMEFSKAPEIVFYYAASCALTFLIGTILKALCRENKQTMLKHAFLIIVLVWLLFVGFAALPFFWILNISFLDAYFETMSALTTTGLSIIATTSMPNHVPALDIAPKSLIFWRSFLSWIGGIGIVVLALMGIFAHYTKASKLIIAEGREERLKANLINSVREIWGIYTLMTIAGSFMLYLSGMDPFNAINYSMSAISTTGMATTSIGLTGTNFGWQNQGMHNFWIDISLIILMVMGATSFYVHYLFRRKNYRAYLQDAEFKGLVFMGLLSALFLIPKLGLENAFFYAFSAITCGGFDIAPINLVAFWPGFAKFVLIVAMFVGGSSGSTAGGIKMARFLIFVKSVWWKAKEAILPKNSFFPRKFEGRDISNEELSEIYLFILLYLFFIALGVFILTLDGASIGNALFEVVSAQGNVGLSVGITRPGMNPASEIMLIINMFVGRLEIIPVFSILGLASHLHRRKR